MGWYGVVSHIPRCPCLFPPRRCLFTVMLTLSSCGGGVVSWVDVDEESRTVWRDDKRRASHRRRKPTVIRAASTGNYPYRQSFNCSQRRAGRPTCTYHRTRPLGAVYGRHTGIFFLQY